jgi:hypothetical protein
MPLDATTEVENLDQYSAVSRYKNIRYYRRDVPGVGQRVEHGLWEPPPLPGDTSEYLYTQVYPGEESRLDIVSARVYRIEGLWWYIAYANNMIDPFEEVTVDLKLRYPSFEWVAANVLT